ncbi:Alpha/Beta hydrolase protein [Xylariaceae sp. FL1651]|nr:Alpha/Beta hydrolase protein [Xylariaceae sp. FL1651]
MATKITCSEGPTVTHRSDLSTLYKILKTALRPLRSHIISIKGGYPAGSPRLEKHPRRIGNVSVEERRVEIFPSSEPTSEPNTNAEPKEHKEILWVYDFNSPVEPTRGRAKDDNKDSHTIYYFAGGGFQMPPSSEQWKFCAHLASSLAPSKRVVLISYPLAPNSPAHDSLPILRRWLAQALQRAEAEHGIVSLVGDSAGGNVALSLGLWRADQLAVARRDAEADAAVSPSRTRLRSVVAISPPNDMRNRNPAAPLADAQDPVLGKPVTDGAARAWSLGSDKDDPYLSPNLADLANLKASGMSVYGVIGTADVLAPDGLIFLEKCKEQGVKGEWLVWEGQMHCFPIAACHGLKKGKEGREWVERALREVTYR